MAKDCILEISDEANIRFKGLDVQTRRNLSNKVKFFQQSARHTPAFKLGRWDGCIRFCDVGGRSFVHLLDRLLPIVQEAGYLIHIDDKRKQYDFKFEQVDKDSYSHVIWPEGHVHEGEPVILRDHQVTVINKYIENLQSIQSVSTGAGKTIITAILANKVEPYGRSLTIVPSVDLVIQTEADFKNFGLDVGVYYGDRKEPGHKHTVCTWQSIEALDKKSKYFDPDLHIDDFVEGVVSVIVDESHGAKADVLKKHLTSTFANCPLRWGMTGTIPLEEHEQVALTCGIGPVVHKVTAKELQDLGILSRLEIEILQLNDAHVMHDSYQSELKFLVTDLKRLNWLAEHIEVQRKEGNTLILVDRVATGELLLEMIPGSVFIYGGVSSKDRKTHYSSIKTADNEVTIATYGVAAVGIDIPRIFNLYLFEPGKSFVRVIQSIGRGIRKAKDKDFVNIFDVTSSAKYSKKHLTERKKFYKSAEYPFKIKRVKYLDQI